MQRALIIINPRARGVTNPAELCREIPRLLAERGVAATVGLAPERDSATHAAERALTAGYDLVVAAGGDGVVNRVAQGLVGSQIPLGFIPLGTGNSLGMQSGLSPGDLAGACDVIAAGHTRRVDVGVLNGRVFLGIADIGLTALVQRQVSSRLKARFGVAAFADRFMKTLPHVRPWQFRARLDGESLRGRMWAMFLVNGRHQVWRVPLNLTGSDDDGLLQVVLVRDCSRKRLLGLARDAYLRHVSIAAMPEVWVSPARSVELETCPSAPWEVDGEVGHCTPISAHIRPRALRLIAPPHE